MKTGPQNAREAEVFAIETLRADVQYIIEKVMNLKGITRKDLATRMNCSPSNISQMLAEDGNMELETLGRIFFALGDSCEFKSLFLNNMNESWQPVMMLAEADAWEQPVARSSEQGRSVAKATAKQIIEAVMRDFETGYQASVAVNQNDYGNLSLHELTSAEAA